jgi:hypothetical protein
VRLDYFATTTVDQRNETERVVPGIGLSNVVTLPAISRIKFFFLRNYATTESHFILIFRKALPSLKNGCPPDLNFPPFFVWRLIKRFLGVLFLFYHLYTAYQCATF